MLHDTRLSFENVLHTKMAYLQPTQRHHTERYKENVSHPALYQRSLTLLSVALHLIYSLRCLQTPAFAAALLMQRPQVPRRLHHFVLCSLVAHS